MKKIEKRRVERLGGVLLYGGALAAGMALGAFSLVRPATDVAAGEHNYVKGVSHDAVAGVRLDEEITIRFKSAVLRSSVGPDTILIRTGSGNTNQARGTYVTGKFMYDKSTQRRVVIRPEAIREYYQLVQGFSRVDAERKTDKIISRMERTGRIRRLDKIDRALVAYFGPSYDAGTRLDSDSVAGLYPPQLNEGDSLADYREKIAGDDALYEDYLINGNVEAFDELSENSEYERFYHAVDAGTGVPDDDSVLRLRSYRQVLVNRRNERRVLFVPQTPIRADLDDSGLVPSQSYSIIIPASQPGVFNTVLTKNGRRPLLQAGGRDFSTLFTTVAGTVTSSTLYLGGEARTGVASLQKPRIICVTPPNGEAFVDATTDWENPDNQFDVPLQARRTFTVRVRFAQPIDPRSVSPSNFTISKTKSSPGEPDEMSFEPPIPVAVGTFLTQSRPGLVEVEVTPATNLDPQSEYRLSVRGNVRTLGSLADGSQALLGSDFNASFIVGPGPVPVSGIQENFDGITNRADPNNADSLGLITTAMWNAPPLFDAEDSGKLVAAFMPFVGWGEGAPADPLNPPIDPDDPAFPPVTDLELQPGEEITFVTEGLDPADTATFGKQITYEYRNVVLNGATANVLGRYPLVLRSQETIILSSSSIFANGAVGKNGVSNADTVSGPPTGGLGGSPGSGGFRGGDGAMAPLTDDEGQVILDGFGREQFDPTKFNGLDGFPTFLADAVSHGGAGSGGFSGDQEGPTANNPETGEPAPEASPARTREAGGGGGHATRGGDGAGTGGTATMHPGGYFGGVGGSPYGEDDMSDQPIDPVKGVPFLGDGAGGAGGAGGGGEDDPNVTTGVSGTPGPEDAGGGGGGGGGGGIQLVARTLIRVRSSIIDASGGVGGRTFSLADGVGEGAAGGCGAGGTIWMQCWEQILIENGSTVNAGGGVGSQITNIGTVSPDPPDEGTITGLGGVGGDGYVRLEDQDGFVNLEGQAVTGSRTSEMLRADINGFYPAFPGVPLISNQSEGYSRWFNTQLDTPTYVPLYDDPLTPEIEGTAFEAEGQMLDILVRTAPGSLTSPGRPDLNLATPWTPLDDVGNISDRRFLQFRVDFEIGLSYLFDEPRPFVDFVSIAVEL